MGWFSGTKKTAPPAPAPTKGGTVDVTQRLQTLLEQEETLTKREQVLEMRMTKELTAAREAQQKGNKTVALRHLKQKKAYEEQKERLSGQMTNLMQMRMKLEEMQASASVYQNIEQAAQDMTRMNKNMNADKIADVMDKVQEANDDATDVLNALAQPIGGALEDDDDLLAELDAMDAEELDSQFMQMGAPVRGKLPAVGAKAQPVAEDEDDLEELERMMNAA